jgi:uncharacterized membrane protein YccC
MTPQQDSREDSQQLSHFQQILQAWKRWASSPNGMSFLRLNKIAFKTAVAATLSYIIATAFHWQYPFYAVVAAIIVISPTAGNTWTLSIQRLIGTTIGAVGGALFAIAFGNSPWSLMGSVFLTILLTSVWKFNEAAKLAGYLSAIVILNYHHSPWLYAWGRFLETLLGIGAAVVVNNLLLPTHAEEELRRCLSEMLLSLEEFYQLVTNGALANTYDRARGNELKLTIINSFSKSRELWKEVRQGSSNKPAEAQINEVWEFLVHRIWEHILTMEHTILVRQQDTFWQMLAPYLNQLAQDTSTAMLELAAVVKSHKTAPTLNHLETTLSNATEQVQQIQNQAQTEYPLDELLRFFTFFYTMEEIGRKLQRMAANLNSNY